jgi:hypothetical protein
LARIHAMFHGCPCDRDVVCVDRGEDRKHGRKVSICDIWLR